MMYIVTLPPSLGYEARTLWGIGTFLAGVPREVDIGPGQVAALKSKGFEVIDANKIAPKGQAARQGKLAETEEE